MSNLMHTLGRIGLWFGSLLLSVALFCLLFSGGVTIFPFFRVTVRFALPAWCLYLPLVIAIKDADEGRLRALLFIGILIGPASVVLWSLILQLRGSDPLTIWHGDPLTGVGGISGSIFALIVGSLTTCFYVTALKVLYRRSTAAKS
jgi:hypothetical protein